MAIITLNTRAINRSDTASSDQVWTATSATASDFQDAAGGSHTLLTTTNVTSAASEVAFTSGIDSTYRRYKVTWDSLIPATDSATLRVQIYVGGAYKTDSYYNYFNREFNSGGSVGIEDAKTGSYFRIMNDGTGSSTGENANGELIIFTPSDTTEKKSCYWNCSHTRNDGEMCRSLGTGNYSNGESAMTGLKFYMSSGNIDTALFKLYGIT